MYTNNNTQGCEPLCKPSQSQSRPPVGARLVASKSYLLTEPQTCVYKEGGKKDVGLSDFSVLCSYTYYSLQLSTISLSEDSLKLLDNKHYHSG